MRIFAGVVIMIFGSMIASTGIDAKHGQPVEKWVGIIMFFYGLYVFNNYFSTKK